MRGAGRWPLPVVLGVVGMLASCAQQTNKFAVADYAGAARQVAVAAYMSGDRVAADVETFKVALGRQLGNCGVQSTFVGRTATYGYVSAARPYTDDMALADVSGITADAVLIVAETKQHLATQNFRTQEIGREYRLRYYDVGQKRVMWGTDLYMSGATVLRVLPSGEKSERLAEAVVTALAADRMLKGCPATSGTS